MTRSLFKMEEKKKKMKELRKRKGKWRE